MIALLDTGASLVNLAESRARRAGVRILGRESVHGIGDLGQRGVGLGRAATLEMGSLRFEDCVVRVVPDRFLTGAAGGARAILGLSHLYPHYVVEIDMPARRLELEPYTAAESAEARDEQGSGSRRAPGIPIRIFGDDVLVPARLGEAVSTHLLLDTGSLRTLVARRVARPLGPARSGRRRIVGFAGNVAEAGELHGVDLRVGDLGVRLDEAQSLDLDGYAAATGHGVGGILGSSVLEDLRIRIDYRGVEMALER
jgi:hypothetical protein